MISAEIIVDLLGIRRNYITYEETLTSNQPLELKVSQDLSHPSRHGFLYNDGVGDLVVSFNDGKPFTLKSTDDPLNLSFLVIEKIVLRSNISPRFRLILW